MVGDDSHFRPVLDCTADDPPESVQSARCCVGPLGVSVICSSGYWPVSAGAGCARCHTGNELVAHGHFPAVFTRRTRQAPVPTHALHFRPASAATRARAKACSRGRRSSSGRAARQGRLGEPRRLVGLVHLDGVASTADRATLDAHRSRNYTVGTPICPQTCDSSGRTLVDG